MKKNYVLVLTIFFIFMVLFFARPVTSGLIENKDKISNKVFEKFVNQEKIRVYIELENSEKIVNSRLLNKEEIKGEDLKKDVGESLRYDFGDKISAELSSEEIEKISLRKDVKNIEIVGVREIMLSDSVPLINASDVWSLVVGEVNLTGAGESVCVIDTGVYYQHPDLGGCFGENCKVNGGWDFVNDDSDPTDDNGHGTHVAGIIAANGSLKGVARDANIIALKACNAAGSCSDDDIEASINWCVNNASRYNISVISMSLGGGLYSSYCDSDPLASAINNANNSGISVVIAAGNGLNNVAPGRANQIAAPGCVSGAIPVSAVTKSDVIDTNYANRNQLVKLLAPGTSITSTYNNGGYASSSGTSMATPHVSGAIAIINQYLRASGKNKTPQQIEDLLNETGKFIVDSGNNGIDPVANYSRINVYEALVEIQYPNVSLISPENNSKFKVLNEFICSGNFSREISNVSFYLWNSSDIVNYSVFDVDGNYNLSNITYNVNENGEYFWNCEFQDIFGEKSFAKNNNSFILDLTEPEITILSPRNNSWNNGEFNVSLNEEGYCEYSLDSGENNYSMSLVNESYFSASNYTLNQNQSYNISYYCNDSVGNVQSSEVLNFSIDYITPEIIIESPTSGISYTGSQNISFIYNVSDNIELVECILQITGSSNYNISNYTEVKQNETNQINYFLGLGNYNWFVQCEDEAGNYGNSSLRSISLNAEETSQSSGSSSGGGGGGGGSSSVSSTGAVYVPSNYQIEAGYTGEYKSRDSIKFQIFDSEDGRHSLLIDGIGEDYVNFTLKSDPVKFTLGIGQSAKFNLTSESYYDLLIKLDNILNNRARITIQKINDPIVVEYREINTSVEGNKTSSSEETKDNKNWIIVVIALAVMVILVYFYEENRRKSIVNKMKEKWKSKLKRNEKESKKRSKKN